MRRRSIRFGLRALFLFCTLGFGASLWADQCCDAGCDANCEGCRAFQQQCQQAPIMLAPGDSAIGQPSSPEMTPTPADGSTAPEVAPGEQIIPDSADLAQQAPAMDFTPQLAQGTGLTLSSQGVPDMIGDFFSSGYIYALDGGADLHGATVTAAGGDRRFKLAENNSPFPRNRVFFNFNHFRNALTDINGIDANLNRYTFGVESTIFNDRSSVEFRLPFAGTLDSTQVIGADEFGSTEVGNVAIALKHMFFRNQCTAISAGLGIVLPTGSDSQLIRGTQTDLIFGNDSIHLQPFLGVFRQSTDKIFWQFFTQLDFDASGNDVIIPSGSQFQSTFFSGPSGDEVNELSDQTLLMLDLSVGYWLHQDRRARYITAIAPMLELHYTTTIDRQEFGTMVGRGIFEETNFRDALNLTAGLFFRIGEQSSLKIGAVSPLREGFDRMFDAEFGIQFSRGF